MSKKKKEKYKQLFKSDVTKKVSSGDNTLENNNILKDDENIESNNEDISSINLEDIYEEEEIKVDSTIEETIINLNQDDKIDIQIDDVKQENDNTSNQYDENTEISNDLLENETFVLEDIYQEEKNDLNIEKDEEEVEITENNIESKENKTQTSIIQDDKSEIIIDNIEQENNKTMEKRVDVVEQEQNDINIKLQEIADNIENLNKALIKEKALRRKYHLSLFLNIILVITLVVAFVFSGFDFSFDFLNKDNTIVDNTQEIEEEVIVDLGNESFEEKLVRFKNTFLECQGKAYYTNDYKAQIIFESEIINEPVMQGKTNDTYLRTNYETGEYDICGPVFIESTCDLKVDQNIVLYGHNRSTYYDPEHVIAFSPLHVLEKEENYEDNKIIYMVYQDRVDAYQVVSVFDIYIEVIDDVQYLYEDEPLYYVNNYTQEEFNYYISQIKAREKYDTGVDIEYSDDLLTLQTCYEDSYDKLIILAKKVSSYTY